MLPVVTRTEMWERAGRELNELSPMSVDELVDAALIGFYRREAITLPLLPEVEQWDAYDAARRTMPPQFSGVHPAELHLEARIDSLQPSGLFCSAGNPKRTGIHHPSEGLQRGTKFDSPTARWGNVGPWRAQNRGGDVAHRLDVALVEHVGGIQPQAPVAA